MQITVSKTCPPLLSSHSEAQNNGFSRVERKHLFTMLSSTKLQPPKPAIFANPIFKQPFIDKSPPFRRRYTLPQASLRFAKVSDSIASPLYSNPNESSRLTSSVGQPPLQLSQWTLTQKHFVLLNVVACVVSLSVLIFEIFALIALGSRSKTILFASLRIQFNFHHHCRQRSQHHGYS